MKMKRGGHRTLRLLDLIVNCKLWSYLLKKKSQKTVWALYWRRGLVREEMTAVGSGGVTRQLHM